LNDVVRERSPQGAYISQTLKIDETADQTAARVAIYRNDAPWGAAHRDAVETLFNGLFYSEDRYDLSAVRRMKFNRRAYPEKIEDKAPAWLRRFYARTGAKEALGEGTLSNDDILAVVGILVELRNGRGEIDDIDHLGNRRVRSVGELAENQFRAGLVRVERAVKGAPVAGGIREPDAARPDQRQADLGGDQGIFRIEPAVAVHGPDQTPCRKSPQAARLGAGAGRPDARSAPASRCATCIRRTTAASARSRHRKGRTSA